MTKKKNNLRTKALRKDILIYKSMDIRGRSSVDDRWITSVQSSPLGVRTGPGPYTHSKGSKDGGDRLCFVFRDQKTRRRNMGRLLCKNLQNGQEDMDTDGIALSV